MTPIPPSDGSQPKSNRVRWALWVFAAVALFLLLAEHRAHALGWLLHGLLGLCVVLLYLVIRADSDRPGDDGEGR